MSGHAKTPALSVADSFPLALCLGLWLVAISVGRAADAGARVAPPVTARGETLVVTNRLVEVPIRRSAYVMRSWEGQDDGLPQNVVNAIEQTPDGYLWLGTSYGLVRFDGITFRVFDTATTPELRSSRIRWLFIQRDGRLWILSEVGDVTSYWNGTFTSYGAAQGVPPNGLRSLAEDAKGTLWAGSRFVEGFLRFEQGKFLQVAKEGKYAAGSIFSLVAESDGSVWGIQPNPAKPGESWPRLLYRFNPGVPTVAEPFRGPTSANPTNYLVAASRDGGTWLATQLGVHLYRGGHCVLFLQSPGLRSPTSLLEDGKGNVWVGTRADGLYQFDRQGTIRRIALDEAPTAMPITALLEDREGSVWVGLAGGGLRQLRPRAFSNYDSRDGLAPGRVQSVCEDKDDTIWVVTQDRIDRLRDGVVEGGIGGSIVLRPHVVVPGADGVLWIGSYGSGLFRYQGGKATRYRASAGSRLYGPRIWGLHLTRQNEILVAARDSLYGLQNSKLVPQLPAILGPGEHDVRVFAEDAGGRLFVGLGGEGLLIRDQGKWTRFTTTNGLPGNDISALHVDADGALWMGTVDQGLSRFKDGRCFQFTASGLPRIVSSILEDDAGCLWLGSNQGVFRVDRRQLNELAEGRPASITPMKFGAFDGLTTSECSGGFQPAAWKAHDGRLWFATAKGVSVVNPRELPPVPRAPAALIEEVSIDDRPVRTEEQVTVPPGGRRLEVRYTAPSFITPGNLRFRYKLDGLDQDWHEVGTRHVAYFQGLEPGNYRFQVAAGNSEGIWNERVASFAFAVQPFYWQTSSFRVAVAAAGIGLLVLFYQRRIAELQRRRQAQQEFSRALIESQELERKRMARELHDSLGQSMLLVKNRAIMGRDRVADPKAVAAQLDEISEAASTALHEVRSIAYSLRPVELDRLGLTKAIAAMLERVSATASVRVESELDDVTGALKPEQEIHLYRVIQESLNNVIKHSGANSVIVELKREPGAVRAVVYDDGRGFDPTASRLLAKGPGGMGLNSMDERVRVLGGQLQIQSAPGKGTRLTAIIPLAASTGAEPAR
jgi:signal transduction histidine kinase/ligand-binding sensor domain-containing protein